MRAVLIKPLVLLAGVSMLAAPSLALNLDLPGQAELTREVDLDAETYFLPTGPVADGEVPTRELEGRVVRQAWRIEGEGLSSLGLVRTIREQLQTAGYEFLLDCTADECGGFDFRFSIDVLPAPDMFVDIFDFRFLSARNPQADGAEYISALVSRAGQAGYVQLVLVGADQVPVVTGSAATQIEDVEQVSQEPEPNIIEFMMSHGHAVIPNLIFATGSSDLAGGSNAALTALAEFLNADPARRVALVGHTDAVGALEDNVTLSRARAASVLEKLIEDYGVSEDQVESNGMGYLAPVAPNTTPEGRRANRRVEAVLLNTE